MAIFWIILIIAVLYVLHKQQVLVKAQRMFLLADEALANRIIEAERLKSAEIRLELYDREDSDNIWHRRHMCLTPGCRNPVIGKSIFAHCEKHLARYEQRWLEDKLESEGWPNSPEDEDRDVEAVKKANEARDKELIQQNASNKMQAIAEARDLLKAARARKLERRAYLPLKLQYRIERTEEEQQKAIGGSWLPPTDEQIARRLLGEFVQYDEPRKGILERLFKRQIKKE